jgi:hypothetical protein
MAMMLLSRGWKARYVEAGGGGMNVVITYKKLSYKLPVTLTAELNINIPAVSFNAYLECHHVK